MIYLNNAGTSWPKPSSVAQAMERFQKQSPLEWNSLFELWHLEVCRFFQMEEPGRFILTPGCTSALAQAMTALPWEEGDVLLTSSHEHHALGRWAEFLAHTHGVIHQQVSMNADGLFDLDEAESWLQQGRVRLVACSMASNVTGALLPAASVVELSHQYGAMCLLDGAQVAGCLPLDLPTLGADFFAFAGHKGTLGPQGIGGLYVAPSVSTMLSYCDLGSVNMVALAGLVAGLQWLQEQDVAAVRERTVLRTQQLLDGLHTLPHVIVYGPSSAAERTAAVSIRVKGMSVSRLGQRLRNDYGILGSAGRQCARMAHRALGTLDEGTLRLSAGPFTTRADMDEVLHCLARIT